jgi:hypothetical protein
MNEIDHFKFCVLYSDDMTADMDHLHVKRIYLVNFSYIVTEDADTELYQCQTQLQVHGWGFL